jgi:nicotinamidase-related amidase
MPLSQLDANCALIVIDLQKGIVGLPTAHPSEAIVGQTVQLINVFRAKGLPVVLVNVNGAAPGRTDAGPSKMAFASDWAELVPELGHHVNDHHVTKQRRGAFLGTDLHAWLTEHGVTQVVMAGIATSIGVESTARSAYDYGYHVVFAVDAMTDLDAGNHNHCIEKIFPRMGETATTQDVLSLVNLR